MHYMVDPVLESVQAMQQRMGPPTKLPARYLMPQFAADFLAYQLYRVSWPELESSQMIAAHHRELMLSNELKMWRLIRKNVEPQFDGEFSDSLFQVFGVRRDEVRTLLQDKYDADLECHSD